MQAEQALSGGIHGVDVEAALPPYDRGAGQGVGAGGAVGHPVGVAALQGCEAGVEAVSGDAQRPQDDVVGQEPAQSAFEVRRVDVVEVDVGHLSAGVDAGVGAARAGERGGLGSRRIIAMAASTSPWTVRRPGWMAHPRKPVPS